MAEQPDWKTALEQIKVKLNSTSFETWFAQTKLVDYKEGLAKIGCKNSYIASALDLRFHNMIKKILSEQVGKDVELSFIVQPQLAIRSKSGKPDGLQSQAAPLFQSAKEVGSKKMNLRSLKKKSALNPDYAFNRFVVGSSNRLAEAAAKAVAEKPGDTYNPLFVYGGVGLGKTHLLHSIGNYALELDPEMKVQYSATENILNELIEGIRKGSMSKFREKYRELDIWIIDDIQFIAGKEAFQEEFFNTFNTLYQSGKQIIAASDRPPNEIAKLEDRVRSRLEGGLVADISAPDYEMRMAILTKKCEEYNYALSEAVLMAISEEIKHNVRELEGALTTIVATSEAQKKKPTVAMVKKLLRRSKGSMREQVSAEDIIEITCEHFGVLPKDILGRGRTSEVSTARQVAMYLIRDMLGITLEKVASAVNRKDHTTVIHAVEKVEEEMKDPTFRQKTEDIRLALSQKAQENENASVSKN